MEIRDLLGQPRDVLERICEGQCRYSYLGDGVGLTRVLAKYMMYVSTRDISVAPHFMMEGYWESWITQALVKLPRGIRCIDVGANHGYYSILLADLCKGEVFAFEPQADLAELIEMSAHLCGFRDQVKVIDKAVGDRTGVVSMEPPVGGVNDTASWRCTGLLEENLGGYNFAITTLDEAVEGKVGFIKIDAEGYEDKVWAGMTRHLESRPIILMEFTPHLYSDAKGFLDEIASCYTLREVNTGGSIVVSDPELLLTNEFTMLWLEAEQS